VASNQEDLPTLVAQTGPLNGIRFPVEDTLMIGRDDTCQVVIPNRQVSRYHARLLTSEQGVQLEDLGSKNGTHCNGRVVSDPVMLQDGDVIQIALVQQFVYTSSDVTATIPLEEEAALIAQGPRRLRLEKRSRRVWVGHKELTPPLSVSQFRLLELLFESQDRVIDRKELIMSVWGEDDAIEVSEQALDALIRRLRDRLAAVDPTHTYLITVRGHGLRLDNPPLEGG
jgi:pSer/pThr/pTyr-binding forkhead associated (FHA) protein